MSEGEGGASYSLCKEHRCPPSQVLVHNFSQLLGLFWTQTKSGKKNTKSEAMTLPLLASFPAVLSSPEAVLNLQPKGGNTYVAVNHCHKRRFLCRGESPRQRNILMSQCNTRTKENSFVAVVFCFIYLFLIVISDREKSHWCLALL